MWVWIWTFCKLAGSVDFKNEGKWIVDETMFWILRTYIRLRHRSFAEKVVHDVWNPISINPEYCGYISVYRAGWRYKNLRNPTVLTVGVCQVDKTEMLEYTNKVMNTLQGYICNSRPRRFGKSITANMLTAYYSKGCDSQDLFAGLKISEASDFKKHLNQYDVIHLDIQLREYDKAWR